MTRGHRLVTAVLVGFVAAAVAGAFLLQASAALVGVAVGVVVWLVTAPRVT